jgi:hypothetical protein
VAKTVSPDVRIEWYGDADKRSYRTSFKKIEALGWKAKLSAQDGVREIVDALNNGTIDKTTETLTLEWYKTLKMWQERIAEVTLYGGLLEIDAAMQMDATPRIKAMRG